MISKMTCNMELDMPNVISGQKCPVIRREMTILIPEMRFLVRNATCNIKMPYVISGQE